MPSLRLVVLLELVAAANASLSSRATLTPVKSDAECGCYLTDGLTPEYYTHHAFFDFRSLSLYAGVPDAIDSYEESSKAPVTSNYFDSDEWNAIWGIQDWGNADGQGKGVSLMGDATLRMTNSPNNVYIEQDEDEDADSDTYLTMRTKRFEKFQSAAEFESIDAFHHVSIRMLARVRGSPGACVALFTYRDPFGGHSEDISGTQEADIEILTKDPRHKISYTNQPAFDEEGEDIPGATRNATMPSGKAWSEWVEHRLDWTPEMSTWYVDGEKAAKIGFQAPRDPAQIMLNAWSDGGSWSGVMPVGEEAFMQIKWIEMVYNTTARSGADPGRKTRRSPHEVSPRGGVLRRTGDDEAKCSVVCSIDKNEEVGRPVILPTGSDEPGAGAVKSDSGGGKAAETPAESGAPRSLSSLLSVLLATVAIAWVMG